MEARLCGPSAPCRGSSTSVDKFRRTNNRTGPELRVISIAPMNASRKRQLARDLLISWLDHFVAVRTAFRFPLIAGSLSFQLQIAVVHRSNESSICKALPWCLASLILGRVRAVSSQCDYCLNSCSSVWQRNHAKVSWWQYTGELYSGERETWCDMQLGQQYSTHTKISHLQTSASYACR